MKDVSQDSGQNPPGAKSIRIHANGSALTAMDKTGFATLWRDHSERADHQLRQGIITLATGITTEQDPYNQKASTPMLKSQKYHQKTQSSFPHCRGLAIPRSKNLYPFKKDKLS